MMSSTVAARVLQIAQPPSCLEIFVRCELVDQRWTKLSKQFRINGNRGRYKHF
jgi:hypothetical protein